jgi:hypothetical protein
MHFGDLSMSSDDPATPPDSVLTTSILIKTHKFQKTGNTI